MAFELTWRQQRFYTNRVKVYRAGDTIDATTKERSDQTFAVVAGLENVPALFFFTQNDSDGTGIARMKRRSPLTEDGVKVPADAAVLDQDLLVDVTPGANYGTVYRVEGEPKVRPSRGMRLTNERVLQLMSEPKPPAEVTP